MRASKCPLYGNLLAGDLQPHWVGIANSAALLRASAQLFYTGWNRRLNFKKVSLRQRIRITISHICKFLLPAFNKFPL